MKLETKRFLAKEWLILLGLTVILFLGRDGLLRLSAVNNDWMIKIVNEEMDEKGLSQSILEANRRGQTLFVFSDSGTYICWT